jgi:hypothetical protein
MKRRHRAHPAPRWLVKKGELNEIAQRRTLMLLDVLSGMKPVTDAIAEAQISRATYYKLEDQALKAILESMEPGALQAKSPELSTRMLEMEEQLKRLTADKRRLEKILTMTRKVLRPGPMKAAPGRPRSAGGGKSALPRSTTSKPTHVEAPQISSSDPNSR